MKIRELVIDWLTASRHVKWLEARHVEMRADYEGRLADKNAQIEHQRLELISVKLECERMRLVLMPFGSQAGAEYARKFQPAAEKKHEVVEVKGPLDWRGELERMMEEDGTHGNGRQEVHESTANDGA